eukprot:TRINITY_DN10463_c0_g1_i1.p1 TRINITY_DN10463_c0_g1~~TRINITY_DN10463_c0_g1_i1.p1  ORF type:complete len:517 (+),score=138.43 TRINITY_DN10463_c0_g1_i1:49-1551(+)
MAMAGSGTVLEVMQTQKSGRNKASQSLRNVGDSASAAGSSRAGAKRKYTAVDPRAGGVAPQLDMPAPVAADVASRASSQGSKKRRGEGVAPQSAAEFSASVINLQHGSEVDHQIGHSSPPPKKAPKPSAKAAAKKTAAKPAAAATAGSAATPAKKGSAKKASKPAPKTAEVVDVDMLEDNVKDTASRASRGSRGSKKVPSTPAGKAAAQAQSSPVKASQSQSGKNFPVFNNPASASPQKKSAKAAPKASKAAEEKDDGPKLLYIMRRLAEEATASTTAKATEEPAKKRARKETKSPKDAPKKASSPAVKASPVKKATPAKKASPKAASTKKSPKTAPKPAKAKEAAPASPKDTKKASSPAAKASPVKKPTTPRAVPVEQPTPKTSVPVAKPKPSAKAGKPAKAASHLVQKHDQAAHFLEANSSLSALLNEGIDRMSNMDPPPESPAQWLGTWLTLLHNSGSSSGASAQLPANVVDPLKNIVHLANSILAGADKPKTSKKK